MSKGLTDSSDKLPRTYEAFTQKFPQLQAAHEQVGKAVDQTGPLDVKTCSLVKMGIALGAGLESAFRSHVRRALEHDASREEIEQALLLSMNTLGFPRAVMAWQWASQQIDAAQDRTES
jgi:4-carboxymuconolactone decarboxylase